MQEIIKLFTVLGGVFLLLSLVFNILPKHPMIPGDIYLDKLGFKIYIPFTSAIVASVVLTLLLNFLKK